MVNPQIIIYCPLHRPFTSISKRWEQIEHALSEAGVKDYDMVQSEKAQSVERLIQTAINKGYKDIIIAGGDSALNDAVNCLMRLEKQEREGIALGVIPNGVMNDFASFWGLSYNNISKAAQAIAERRIRKVDAGCIRYTSSKNESIQRYFLNSINIGLLANIQRLRQATRRKLWSRKISFAMSLLLMITQKIEYKITYTINYVTETHHIMTMCIGSALGYGQTPNAVPYNGQLDITIVRRSLWMQMFEAIYLFMRGKILAHKRVRPYRAKSIEISSNSKLPLSIDGHPAESPVGAFVVDVLQEEINFIIEPLKR